MLSVNNITVGFGGRYLFDNITFNVDKSDRIGLIGRNGSGKTTILKIIYGIQPPDEGSLNKPNDFTLGYLPQEGAVESHKPIFDETKSALTELVEIENEIHSLTDQIANREDYESDDYADAIQNLNDLNIRFNMLGGNSIESEIEKILIGLGFEREEFFRPVDELSGGWQMRIELAKILLRKPDCILLDEPTNHLDIQSIQWLEDFLKKRDGGVIIVSHDKTFLNSVTNRTIEISNGKIFDMRLPFTRFVEMRQEQIKQQVARYNNQKREIAQTEKFIERFRYKATLASRVQSRIKQLEKVELEEIDEVDIATFKIKFPPVQRSGRIVADLQNLTKKYGEKTVLDSINLTIERNEKIAFVGKNGEGKSTLSKILAKLNDEALKFDGIFESGFNVSTGYFAQHQAELLDGDHTVFDVIDNAATGEMRTRVRSLLGAFLFSGDDVYKKVKVLSGGEKSRLALARLLLDPVNFIILDEPTNHLDMLSKDILKKSLQDFDGTMVIVSHDREFLHELTNRTIYFSNKKLTEYPGDIYEFLEKFRIDTLQELESEKKMSAMNNDRSNNIGKDKLDRENKKALQREQNKIKKLISICEHQISEIEDKISAIDEKFQDSTIYDEPDKVKEMKIEYQGLKDSLKNRMEEWEQLSLQLEELTESNQ